MTSVCGGSIFLAKAGLLAGYRAASHWAGRTQLTALGVDFSTERVVVDRNRITGSGVTAGKKALHDSLKFMFSNNLDRDDRNSF